MVQGFRAGLGELELRLVIVEICCSRVLRVVTWIVGGIRFSGMFIDHRT
jgi:hypothetical protein